jgi:Asp-tRNAAsn/Glu-tRNAGln amidotransferase A subunit and related amidases
MPDLSEEIFFSTIAEWNAKLKAKQISATELARAFAARLEKLGPRYNALALALSERAVKKAKSVDDDLKRDRFRSPLAGIPFGAKDLLSVAGVPTTWGAKPYAAQVFDYDATVLQKLDKAGAVLIGKLSMVELAGGGGYRFPAASLFGPGINPWDRTCWSGGSSSGSGSAVAAGLVPFAIGSETSGSILTPSAYCGITGLRPTYGLVSRYGAMPLSWTMDKLGPMCHSAEDCGLVLAAMAGGDSNDPGSAGKSFYYAPDFARKMDEIRMGYAPVDFAEWAAPEARPAFEQALADLRALGVKIVETKLPEFPYKAVVDTVIEAEAGSVFEPLIRSGKVDDLADKKQIAGLKACLGISAADYLKAMRIRGDIRQAFHRLYSDIDVLLAPARYAPATKLSEPLDQGTTGRPVPQTPGMSVLIGAGNLAGLPALSLPCGFAGKLPVAIQLVGLPFSENMLLAIGKQYQSHTDWHRRRPTV